MEGWIKLHRKLLDNPIVCKDSDHLAIWIYLLLNATHVDYESIFNGEQIILKPGELITGRKSIAKELKIDEYKVQRVLKCFENRHQIAQRTSSQNRLISILKWNEYQEVAQQNAQQMHNECTLTRTKESNLFMFNKYNNDFDVYENDPDFQDYLKTKGINTKQDYYNLTYAEQEKLSEKYVMGG